MADLTTIIKGLQFSHPVLPGPGPNVAGAAEAAAAIAAGAPALILQTVTLQPGDRADDRRTAYGKDGAFHRQPCSPLPFEEWLPSQFTPALKAARDAGVPCIPAIGYSPEEVRQTGRRLAALGADALFYDAHHARREEIRPALQGLKGDVTIPVILRLSPHHGEDLAELAAELEPYVDAFCVIGSFGPALHLDSGKLCASLGPGSLSGAPIRPIAQRFLFEVARRVATPVIAAGGIFTGEDAATALMLGATAVMLSTAPMIKGPIVYGQVAAELDRWLEERGHTRAEAIGRAYLRKYGHGQRVVVEKEEAPGLIAEACITCTLCETVCYYDAIKAPPKTLPTIDQAPCFECGLCVSACPTGALTFRPRDTVTKIPLLEVQP